jgi:hypothetical protein
MTVNRQFGDGAHDRIARWQFVIVAAITKEPLCAFGFS